ncbi:MAG: hypothetical protein B6U68_03530 [Candidatus Aenigmarchaeota archaeon ex4484_14]|nr:MAG: hypothetical protein B6U68_03530 [Candidatus Aenigmarchaeota archaeon ex4484_14]
MITLDEINEKFEKQPNSRFYIISFQTKNNGKVVVVGNNNLTSPNNSLIIRVGEKELIEICDYPKSSDKKITPLQYKRLLEELNELGCLAGKEYKKLTAEIKNDYPTDSYQIIN